MLTVSSRFEAPAARLFTFVALLAVYELAAAAVGNVQLLPTIPDIVRVSYPSFALFHGETPSATAATAVVLGAAALTLSRVVAGLVLGVAAGMTAGLLIHRFSDYRESNELILAFTRNVPLFALVPLFVYWHGTGQVGILAYISFGVFVIIATNTYEAVRNVPVRYVRAARVLGATEWRVLTTVYLPAIAPEIAAGIRTVTGWAWAFSLGAEYITANSGLGYLAYRSYLYTDMGKLLVLAAVYIILGWTGDAALQRILRLRGRPWP